MTCRAEIAHGGPQRRPTRAAPSLVRARRDARGSPPWTPWMIRSQLDRPTMPMQPTLTSTARSAATITPGSAAREMADHVHRNTHHYLVPADERGIGEPDSIGYAFLDLVMAVAAPELRSEFDA